ncbi:hypothetical protein NLX83_16870 [Allokutzneria sp. A3M-2-11 16]|uniref:PIN-like domain-containing protein n=1 Tax=Allokutzneria sp. A3M-2-11 16 TaxID=2962043 RepID=UPI0020B65E52|nr:hypothetical protein [Allokutzneria sp. A3M-2-11 16]MCP3800938.1 hypothetical protein [Allokutzneria sp. A3M-2-11 16]
MSEPPHASSWAAPPEFYLDENAGIRSVRKLLLDLGYVVHTPAELFGTRADACGAPDEVWLARIAGSGWAVLNRDVAITRRPSEFAAYRRAKVHMFYLPGEAKRDELCELVAINLADICVLTVKKSPRLWRLTRTGVKPLDR